MEEFYVEIRAYKNDEVIKRMGPFNERTADKVDSGANRNLDHKNYYTMIIEDEA